MARPKARAAPSARPITDALLGLIRDDGRTDIAIGRAAGIKPDMIRRFRVGERGLTLATLDQLAPALGLRLVRPGRGRRPAAGPAPRTD